MIKNNQWLIILLIAIPFLNTSSISQRTIRDIMHVISNTNQDIARENIQVTQEDLQHIVKRYLLETEHPIEQLYFEPITQPLVENFFLQLTKSQEITDTVLLYSVKKQLSISTVFSLVFVESSFSPTAVNYNRTSSDFGLFQLNSRTFKHLSKTELLRLDTNVDMGTSYLQYAFRLSSDPQMALAIYNAGPRRPLRGKTPESTKQYVGRILQYEKTLQQEFIQYVWNVMNLDELEKSEV